MKSYISFSAFGLFALLAGGPVSAAPFDESALSNIEARDAEAAPAPYSAGLEKRAGISLALQQVINNGSLLFADQLVGAATSLAVLNDLCAHFNGSRLAAQGYNVPLIRHRICSAAKLPALQPDTYIMNLVTLYTTNIWVTQANASFQGDHYLLCDFLNATGVESVGLNSTLVSLALGCNGPNDGGPPPSTSSTTSTTPSTSVAILTTRAAYDSPYGYTVPACDESPAHCVRERVTKRAAYMVPPGSPAPTYDYPSRMSIHIDETEPVEKHIQPQSTQPTVSGAPTHHPSGKPNVTPSPDLPYATLAARA